VYIYLSNENATTVDVYFDDFKYTHVKSNVVAGADYYPFGLPMENREITREDYRYGYQGQYSERDKETGWNAFELRNYDARIGRWLSGDPYGQFDSPYVGMGNNPVTGTDPDGGWCCGGVGLMRNVTAGSARTTLLKGITVRATATGLSNAAIAGVVANGFATALMNRSMGGFRINGLSGGHQIEFGMGGSGGRTENWSNYNADISTPGLSSIPSPETSLSGSISSYLPSAETLQTGLGIAGWIPGVQTVAGLAEAGVALYRGDYWGAGFAAAGAIPVLGYLAKAAKTGLLANRTTRIYRIWGGSFTIILYLAVPIKEHLVSSYI
jgi:RHS repeat-associated protein